MMMTNERTGCRGREAKRTAGGRKWIQDVKRERGKKEKEKEKPTISVHSISLF